LKASLQHDFHVVIDKGENGYFIGSVVELPGCHTQAKTVKELNKRPKEVIELYLEAGRKELEIGKFIALKKVRV